MTASEFIRSFCSRQTVYGILYDTRVSYSIPFYLQKLRHWLIFESLHSMPVQRWCSKIWECLIKEFHIKSGMIYFGLFIIWVEFPDSFVISVLLDFSFYLCRPVRRTAILLFFLRLEYFFLNCTHCSKAPFKSQTHFSLLQMLECSSIYSKLHPKYENRGSQECLKWYVP